MKYIEPENFIIGLVPSVQLSIFILLKTLLLQACPTPQEFLQIKIKAMKSPPTPAELLACGDQDIPIELWLNAHKTAKKQKILL